MEEPQRSNGKKRGGLRTMPFILANEITEKMAIIGCSANMISYLTQQLHVPLTNAATTLNNFSGAANLTPLLGAFVADSYIGRFWTITVASIFYQLGMITLTASAVFPVFRPSPCVPQRGHKCAEARPWQLAVLYTAFFLNSLGAGGIRPCSVTFGADQFDETEPSQKAKTGKFFNWYYFCLGVSILLGVTVLVYIQDNVGWGWGFGIPTIAMAMSIAVFLLGYPLYRRLEPAGSPFTRLAQVMAATLRKRKLQLPADPRLLYENDEMDAKISLCGKLVHTDQLRWFDKAAVITEGDFIKETPDTMAKVPKPWQLSTVHRIEELKSVIRILPIWAAGILAITASAQQNTFTLQQARTMDRHLSPSSSFQIPPGSMSVFTVLTMLGTIAFYDRVLIHLLRRITGLERGISFLHRMGIGFAFSILATFVAGFVEERRRSVATEAGLLDSPRATVPMTAFWLVPQYALHGIAEAFHAVGHIEFLYDQAPESMRSTAAALFSLASALGNFASSILISIIHKSSNWLPDNINKGKLDYFYWVITVLQFINLVFYMICARHYKYKPIQLRQKEAECTAVADNP